MGPRIELTKTRSMQVAAERLAVDEFGRLSVTLQEGAILLARMVDQVKTRDSSRKVVVVLDAKKPEDHQLITLVGNYQARKGAERIHDVCIGYRNSGAHIVSVALNRHVCDQELNRIVAEHSLQGKNP
jgi:ribosomal protein S16